MTRVSEADWAMISVWGWTLVAVIVILAAALLALIFMAIRYLLKRMKLEESGHKQVTPSDITSNRETPNRERVGTAGRGITHDPSPVPPENPHAPPSPSAGLTRPGY
ncbi:MAG TPA: hypothetical protein VEX88_14385 [Glaciibacter sp.]|nr:hypothetical protein [Glaciibacter sp.]